MSPRKLVKVLRSGRTAVMICNPPSPSTSDELVALLNLHAYSKLCDLVHVPIIPKSMR